MDIRGAGDNRLVLDQAQITTFIPNRELVVEADAGDVVTFDDGWRFAHVELVDDRLQRVFVNQSANRSTVTVQMTGLTPLDPIDVSGDGIGDGSRCFACHQLARKPDVR